MTAGLPACSSGSSSQGSDQSITLYNGQHEQTDRRAGRRLREADRHQGQRAQRRRGRARRPDRHGGRRSSPADVFYTENTPAAGVPAEQGPARAGGSVDACATTPSQVQLAAGRLGRRLRPGQRARLQHDADHARASCPTSVLQLADPQWKGKLAHRPGETDFQPIVTSVDRRPTAGQRALSWLKGSRPTPGATSTRTTRRSPTQVNSGGSRFGADQPVLLVPDAGRGRRGERPLGRSPTSPPRDPGYVIDVSGAAVLKSSQHQAAAQKFLAFLVSKAGQEIIATTVDSFEYPIGSGVTTAGAGDAVRPAPAEPITLAELGDRRRRDRAAAAGRAAVTASVSAAAAPPAPARRRRAPVPRPPARRRPLGRCSARSAAVAAVLCVPLVFLLDRGAGAGLGEIARLICPAADGDPAVEHGPADGRGHASLCAVIGTLAAWCVERTDLPGRRIWAVLVVLPLAHPRLRRELRLGLAEHRRARASGRGAGDDARALPAGLPAGRRQPARRRPGQEEVARSLGLGRVADVLAGDPAPGPRRDPRRLPVVALALLAEYGAFEILGFQTFTTEIFTEFQVGFNGRPRRALSLVLVALGLVVLGGEGGPAAAAGSAASAPLGASGPPAARARPRRRRRRSPRFARSSAWRSACRRLARLLDGRGRHPRRSPAPRSLAPRWHTACYSAAAAALATRWRCRSRCSRSATAAGDQRARAQHLPRAGAAGPGDRAGLVFFAVRYAFGVTRAPRCWCSPTRSCSSRSRWSGCGRRSPSAPRPRGGRPLARAAAGWRCSAGHAAAVAPGLAAAFCLVFLSAVTELTATLILTRPASRRWRPSSGPTSSNLSYGAAAPFALVIIGDRRRAQLPARPLLRPAADQGADGSRERREPAVWRHRACTRPSARTRC